MIPWGRGYGVILAISGVNKPQVFAGDLREPVDFGDFGCRPVKHIESREEPGNMKRNFGSDRVSFFVF